MPDLKHNILIAGGGTGGHLFPGIAIAQAFQKRNPANRVLFIGTDRPFEKNILKRAGFDHKSVNAAGLKGMGLWNKFKSALKIPGALLHAMVMVLRFNPSIVIGVGGYSSGPVILAAWLFRKKIMLHEQNILPGITNRILSRFADRVYVSFPETADDFHERKVLVTGNPVRSEILAIVRNTNGPENKTFTVLVAGGSQGAHAINLAVCEAVTHLNTPADYHFIHQTGVGDEDLVKKAYESSEVSFQVQPFFNDMENQYKSADLIICRAGATTIAEITAMGHSSILVPFPHAADNHQEKNALSLVNKGAAEMITEDVLNGELLAKKIELYHSDRVSLETMAENSKAYGRPDAAEAIIDDCFKHLKKR